MGTGSPGTGSALQSRVDGMEETMGEKVNVTVGVPITPKTFAYEFYTVRAHILNDKMPRGNLMSSNNKFKWMELISCRSF